MINTVQILTFLATLAYPFLVVMKSNFTLYIATILAILWFIRAIFENRAFFVLGVFFISLMMFDDAKFLYPVMVNLLFCFIFLYSLKGEAIITKFARLKDKNLPNKAVIYTRNLTKIWICFFMINAIVTLIFGFIDERLWLIYCGFVSYVLVFLLFVVEILYRKFFIK